MFHSVRVFVVAAAVLSLAVVSVPAAHARPLDQKAPAHLSSSWFEAALSWIYSLVPTQGRGTTQQAKAVSGSTDITVVVRPNTGSCIDPLGGGLRCNM